MSSLRYVSKGPYIRTGSVQASTLPFGLGDSLTFLTTGASLMVLDTTTGVTTPFAAIDPATDGLYENFATSTGTLTLVGGAAGSVLVAGSGADTLTGGGGNDRLIAGSGTDTLSGGAGNDILIAGAGKDTLSGGAGNDTFVGGAGADAFDGGTGRNTVVYKGTASVVVDLSGVEPGTNDSLGDTFVDIQNVRGGAGNDTLIGDASRNVLEGGAGADKIVGSGQDVAAYLHSSVGVTVDLRLGSAAQVSAGDAGGDTLTGIENLFGSAHADTLTGDDQANVLAGFGGADTILGEGGNDRIIIYGTPKLVDGGTGINTLDISGAAKAVLTDGSGGNYANFQHVVVADGSTVDMSGVTTAPTTIRSASTVGGTVTIVGSKGADTITGGKGTDIITGGTGNDTIHAGTGAETFLDMMAGFGRDTIYNANLTLDTFDVAGLGADATHLHFASIDNGADTLVYGDGGMNGDALTLKGIALAAAQAGHFTFSTSTT